MDKLCFSFMSEKEHNTACFVGMLYSSINNVIEVPNCQACCDCNNNCVCSNAATSQPGEKSDEEREAIHGRLTVQLDSLQSALLLSPYKFCCRT